MLVFLVDDDYEDHEIFKMAFDKIEPSYALMTAENGIDALEQFKNKDLKPDIIFMDINMPDMDGFEATALIRKLQGIKKNIPIIALTADAMKEDKERCLQEGMNDFISKPFRLIEIESVLTKYLVKSHPDATIISPMLAHDKRKVI